MIRDRMRKIVYYTNGVVQFYGSFTIHMIRDKRMSNGYVWHKCLIHSPTKH